MTEAEILVFVNSDEFMTPEVTTGDICWYPSGKDNIIEGNSLKLLYNNSNKWEKHSDQNHAF